jgi:hypothetical protein
MRCKGYDMKTGIIERLKAAQTFQEAISIVKEGASYKWASPKTKRRWARIVDQKKQEGK